MAQLEVFIIHSPKFHMYFGYCANVFQQNDNYIMLQNEINYLPQLSKSVYASPVESIVHHIQ